MPFLDRPRLCPLPKLLYVCNWMPAASLQPYALLPYVTLLRYTLACVSGASSPTASCSILILLIGISLFDSKLINN